MLSKSKSGHGLDEASPAIAAMVPAALFVLREGSLIWANHATERLTGYTVSELLQRNPLDLVEEQDAALARDCLREDMQSGPKPRVRISRKDGTKRTVEIGAQPVDWPGGPALLCSVLDVTEHFQVEQALRAGHDLFRNVIESYGDIVTIIEDDGTIRYANPALTRHLGWTVEELMGKNALELVHVEDLACAMEGIRLGIEDYRKNPPIEVRVRAADGTYRPYEAASSHYFERDARVGLVCSFRPISDRKQAELDLRESERKYRLLFERNVAGVFLSRLDGRILDCNDAFAQIFGYVDRHEMLHKNADVLYENPVGRNRFVEEVLRRGHLHDYEAQYRRKDGATIWLLESVSVFEPEPGAELLLQGALIDITERKRAEQLQAALYRIANLASSPIDSREYHRHLHLILMDLMYADNMYVAVLSEHGDELRFLYFRDERESNPVRRPLSNGLTEYVIRAGEPILADEALSQELQSSGDIALLGPDSHDWLGAPLRANGATVGVIALQSYSQDKRYSATDLEILNFVAQQISAAIERERGEQALRESEERYRSLFLSAVHGIYRASISQDHFVEVNPALVQMLRYESADALKRVRLSADIYVDAEERTAVLAEVSANSRIAGREVRWKRSDGEQIFVRLSGRALPESADVLEIIVEDVTERRRLEARLNHTQKMEAVGQLASGIAHEFNNLLTIIKGYSELLSTQPLDQPQASHVEEIIKAASKAGDLTRQLQTFSRDQQGSPRWIDINSVIHGIMPLLLRTVKGHARLRLQLAPCLALICADPASIEHILINLVLNARDAVQENGEIVIETAMHQAESPGSEPMKHVMLSVRDNGVGIAPEVKDRIFDPFFTTKDVGKGTGLGLSAVYGIVQQARGTLSVKSSPGEGTVVTACFAAQQDETARVPVGQRRTVLLVEDQDSLRTLVAEVLSARGFEVISAASSEEALEAFAKADRIDLLLTDILLGEMSGTELAFRLSNRYPKLGVLFTSGYLPEPPLDTQGAGHFLAKPFTAEALMAKIDEILAAQDS